MNPILEGLKDARRALQQWHRDRRLGYDHDRPQPKPKQAS
jgi:hypothetical protein